MKLQETQLFYLVIKSTRSLELPEARTRWNLTELSVSSFVVLMIALLLMEILVIKYVTTEIERRAIEIKFVNHMVNFSF